jgi:DNA-binding SARP family transcriptional activator
MANEGEPAPNTPFRFNLIGRFAVQERGQQLPDAAIGSRKGRTLLKLLLVNRGHMVPADLIAEVLWGDRPPPKAEENLASLVSRLRGRFGPRIIQGGRRGYAFAVGPWAQTDLDEAERLAAEAEARLSAGEPSLGTIAAERAIALLGAGRLLEEEADPSWAEGSQAHLDRLAGRARRSAWMAALLLSDPHRAIRAAQAAIDASPLARNRIGP